MSEYRLQVGVFEWGRSLCPKISGRRGRPTPTILRVVKCMNGPFTWYKNVDRKFFRFVTMHVFDGQTDRRLCHSKTARA